MDLDRMEDAARDPAGRPALFNETRHHFTGTLRAAICRPPVLNRVESHRRRRRFVNANRVCGLAARVRNKCAALFAWK